MVFHLLNADPRYRVRGFTAPAHYCVEKSLLGVPLIAHDDVLAALPPDDIECLSVLGGLGGWQLRRGGLPHRRSRVARARFRSARARFRSRRAFAHDVAVVLPRSTS